MALPRNSTLTLKHARRTIGIDLPARTPTRGENPALRLLTVGSLSTNKRVGVEIQTLANLLIFPGNST